MKNIIYTLLAVITLASCNTERKMSRYSYTVQDNGIIEREMKIDNRFTDIEIKMKGTATFDAEGTTITALSPGGYVEYKNDRSEMKAIKNGSTVNISIYKKGRQLSLSSEEGKQILTEAIKQVKNLQDKHKV